MSFQEQSDTHDLHGNVPDCSHVALVIIDVINDLEFPEGGELLPYALQMAGSLRRLKARCREAQVPAIYVNDNFGRWRSDFNVQLEHCLRDDVRGRPLRRFCVQNWKTISS